MNTRIGLIPNPNFETRKTSKNTTSLKKNSIGFFARTKLEQNKVLTKLEQNKVLTKKIEPKIRVEQIKGNGEFNLYLYPLNT